MGFLKKLLNSFGKPEPIEPKESEVKLETNMAGIETGYDKSEYPFQDKREAKCPYCQGILKKIPGSKTKCAHCKKEMFVKTNPKNIRMVVTKEELEQIEEEWAIVSGRHDIYLEEKKRFKDEEQKLTERFGSKPSENDVKWSLHNQEIIENFQKMNFLSQRVTRYQMGDILRKEKKLKLAIEAYFEVLYLDLNGARNLEGHIADPELFKYIPAFDPQKKFIAENLINYIKKIKEKLGINKEETKELFLKAVEPYKSFKPPFKFPLSPEDCWKTILNEIDRKKE